VGDCNLPEGKDNSDESEARKDFEIFMRGNFGDVEWYGNKTEATTYQQRQTPDDQRYIQSDTIELTG
jgi:hypothetical protein